MKERKGWLDLFGMVSSSVCAVHCLAIPLFISGGLMSGGVGGLNHAGFEWVFILLTFLLASGAILQGFLRHRNLWIVIFMTVSFGLVLIGFASGSFLGHFVMALGGIGLVIGHGYNRNRLLESY